jgi:NAD(P)H-dependent FMN reductase
MTRLLLVCGSQSRASLNARLLAQVAGMAPANLIRDPLRPEEVDLPLFNRDIEADPALRPRLAAIHARFAMADAIILASPEFNGLMTPYLKNLIDWVSRMPHLDASATNAFRDKPVLLCSATPGWSGGGVAMPSLRALLGYVGAVSFGETICLPYARDAWDGAGRLNPALAQMGWQDCVTRFCAFAARLEGAL